MCNIESTHRSRPPDHLSPHCDLMSSVCKDGSTSIWDLVHRCVATILDAKGCVDHLQDYIDHLQATFCHELWPAFHDELKNSRSRIRDLERYVDASSTEREERQQLESEREDERTRLRAENGLLRMELEQRLKEGTRVEADKLVLENQFLQSKVKSLLEQNLNAEKQRESLADEVEQLQLAVKLSTTKELFLKAELQKIAMTRSQLGKSEVLHNRLSLKGQKRHPKNESPSSLMAARDVEPVSSEDPQNLKDSYLVRPACSLQCHQETNQKIGQGIDHVASHLRKKEQVRERLPLETLADKTVDGAAVAVPVDSPPSVEATCQGEPPKNSEGVDAQDIICPQRPKAKCHSESRPLPLAGFVDSDETVMDVVQECPLSGNNIEDYPLVSISSETEAEPCDELLQLPSGRVFEIIPPGAVELKVGNTGFVQKAGPLVSISPNVLSLRPPFRTIVRKKPFQGPKEQSWRQTRHRTEPSDRDPHDSFLDTPREKVLAQLAANRDEGRAESLAVRQRSRAPVTNKFEGGSIEARDVEKLARRHPSASSRLIDEASTAGRPDKSETKAPASKAPPFKFNEPVRKRRDREALQGTECKQCKKFYDAVATGDANGMLASYCEHQDAVSRHRFKYLPPPTPDGFWNIGFDDSPDHAERIKK